MLTLFFINLMGLLSPGPDFFYVSQKAASSSTRAAICAAIGITIGVTFWSILTLFGLGILIQSNPNLECIMMAVGGGYLSYLGIKMAKNAVNTPFAEIKNATSATNMMTEILRGLLINLFNPKIMVFFGSVLSGYMTQLAGYHQFILVLLILTGSALIYFILVALLFSHQKIRLFYAKNNRYIDNITGIILIIFGVKLIYQSLYYFYPI